VGKAREIQEDKDYTEDWYDRALSPRLYRTILAKENRIDVLGVYKWVIWQGNLLVLGEELGEYQFSVVLQAYSSLTQEVYIIISWAYFLIR
jgi:hypothetical protein